MSMKVLDFVFYIIYIYYVILINQLFCFARKEDEMKEKGIAGVTKVIPALTARTQLGQILSRIRDQQDRFLISRRGEAEAVILSVEDYLRSVVKQPEAIAELREAAKMSGVDALSMQEIDAEIAAYRKGQ